MSQPRVLTAALTRVREQAEKALTIPGGIAIHFTVERYGSLDACMSLSRSFQTSFCSLRARVRKDIARCIANPNIAAEVVCSYDNLVCQRLPLPNERGWVIQLFPAQGMIDDWDVTSLETGKPLPVMMTEEKEIAALQARFYANPKKFSPNDNARMAELDPNWDETKRQLLQVWGIES